MREKIPTCAHIFIILYRTAQNGSSKFLLSTLFTSVPRKRDSLSRCLFRFPSFSSFFLSFIHSSPPLSLPLSSLSPSIILFFSRPQFLSTSKLIHIRLNSLQRGRTPAFNSLLVHNKLWTYQKSCIVIDQF